MEGLLFDISHNALWLDEWGAPPATSAERQTRLRELVAEAPTMVPLFAHQCVPAEPCEAGNPVFSIWQSDIILDAPSVWGYLLFHFADVWSTVRHRPEDARRVRFWTPFLELRLTGRTIIPPPGIVPKR